MILSLLHMVAGQGFLKKHQRKINEIMVLLRHSQVAPRLTQVLNHVRIYSYLDNYTVP
jgi:hypothetical protein